MIKTIPLMSASLKEFVRNWKSVLLLIVLPLLLISIVFLSFNPGGLQIIPVGVVISTQEFDIQENSDYFKDLYHLDKYSNLSDCLDDLKKHSRYVCLELKKGVVLEADIYYDNTKEPVIWEIVALIEGTMNQIQKGKSIEMVGDFLSKFDRAMGKIDTFKTNLIATNSKIDVYIDGTSSSLSKLSSAKSELSSTVRNMDNDINQVKSDKSMLKQEKDSFHGTSKNRLNVIKSYSGDIPKDQWYKSYLTSSVDQLDSGVSSFNDVANQYFGKIDNKITEYESVSSKGKEYINDVDEGISQLHGVKQDLTSYKGEIKKSENEISNIQSEFGSLRGADASKIVNPLRINKIPIYKPREEVINKYKEQLGGDSIKSALKGFSLLSLQTIFPTMLFLIILFLSLLIASFMALSEINSLASRRIKLVKGIFFHELLSIYISAIIILIPPIFSLLLIGHFLFKITILTRLFEIFIILFLLSSIFIFFGIGLAYLFKKESITLLISSFILVFLIFFSGFLLPIERMSPISGFVAKSFPSTLALTAFDKIAFHSQPFYIIFDSLYLLLAWYFGLIVILLIIKKTRNV